MDNWDDLRILLAVVNGGSITSGARQLGVDQSTVSRRLQAFENRLDRRFFLDTKKRNQLTPFGEACLRRAQRLEREFQQLEHELRLNDLSFEGSVSILTGDILSDRLLLSVCSEFLEIHPKINLRVSRQTDPEVTFKSDIAILTTNSPKEEYFGKRLATATFASYASHEFLKKYENQHSKMRWLNWDDGSGSPTWPALSPNIPDEMCRLRCTSVESLLEATKIGLGATILPCFIGEKDPDLSRISPGEVLSKREVWVFVQADLRKVPKIRTFLDYLYAKILEEKEVIESA